MKEQGYGGPNGWCQDSITLGRRDTASTRGWGRWVVGKQVKVGQDMPYSSRSMVTRSRVVASSAATAMVVSYMLVSASKQATYAASRKGQGQGRQHA
jgi:hypothetical protein